MKLRLKHDCGKQSFRSQRDAQQAIVRFEKRGVGMLVEYRCFCRGKVGHWHVGHFNIARKPLTRHPMLDVLNNKA